LDEKAAPQIPDNVILQFDRKYPVKTVHAIFNPIVPQSSALPPVADPQEWVADQIEQVLQDPTQRQDLVWLLGAEKVAELNRVFEELEKRAGDPRYSRKLRKLVVPQDVKIYYWGARTSDEAPLVRQQQGVNEYAVVITELKESVKFYVKGEDYSTYPYRRITLVPPPMLTRLEKDEY